MGLLSKKSTWTGAAAICSAIGLVVAGEMTWPEAVPLILGGFGLIFVRHAIMKGK